MLCHESGIEDPTVYIEGFDALCEEGFIRTYGISTNSLNVLKNFYELSNGICAVVEVDYSLINREPEAEFLDYCTEKNLGILVRGPLAKGVLSGKYNRESVFGDTVRDDWNVGQSDRKKYEEMLDKLEAIREAIGDDSKLVETALRYVISHGSNPVVIPGATKVEHVIGNAQAGAALLDEGLYRKLGAIA